MRSDVAGRARGWRLYNGRRRFSELVPDSKYPGMWRSVLAGGRLSDIANITSAKHAVRGGKEASIEAVTRRRCKKTACVMYITFGPQRPCQPPSTTVPHERAS